MVNSIPQSFAVIFQLVAGRAPQLHWQRVRHRRPRPKLSLPPVPFPRLADGRRTVLVCAFSPPETVGPPAHGRGRAGRRFSAGRRHLPRRAWHDHPAHPSLCRRQAPVLPRHRRREIYPYSMPDFLSRGKTHRTYPTVILENDFPRVTFLPELAARSTRSSTRPPAGRCSTSTTSSSRRSSARRAPGPAAASSGTPVPRVTPSAAPQSLWWCRPPACGDWARSAGTPTLP